MYYKELAEHVRYFKETEKGVNRMCQIVEEYAKEKADFQKALAIVEDIENLMETGGMTEKQACKALKRTLKAYKNAKKLLSANEALV
ncbi:MAG: hypothetical protein K6G10_06930 [Butyrivibrio sp.]|nr:hypothetical protein [Butyrivibrio sp.]